MESDAIHHGFILGLIAGIILTLSLGLLMSSAKLLKKDVYDLGHWKLNVRLPLNTMWMNLGYWRTPDGKPIQYLDEACAALLSEVLSTAGILGKGKATTLEKNSIQNESLVVLDLGFGCGDQICELARLVQHGVVSDISYVGLTLNESQTKLASERLARESMISKDSGANVKLESFKLFCANAAQPHSWSPPVRAAAEDLGKTGNAKRCLIALDCLYHFSPSRRPIFDYAAQALDAQLMAFDLILNSEATLKDKLVAKAIGLLMQCPLNAFLTKEQYQDQLVASGYDRNSIVIRDVSQDVFPGLVDYLHRQEGHLRQYGIPLGGLGVAKKAFGWFSKSSVLKAVIVVAHPKGRAK